MDLAYLCYSIGIICQCSIAHFVLLPDSKPSKLLKLCRTELVPGLLEGSKRLRVKPLSQKVSAV